MKTLIKILCLSMFWFSCDYAPTNHSHDEYDQSEYVCAYLYTEGSYYSFSCNIISTQYDCDCLSPCSEKVDGYNGADPIQTCEDSCNEYFNPQSNHSEIYLENEEINWPFDREQLCSDTY